MTARGSQVTRLAAVAACIGAMLSGCSPERLRPGPPALAVEVPAGGTVFSPDTISVGITATDPNGVDSLTVTFLGTTESIDTSADIEVIGLLSLAIPAGLQTGQVLSIFTRAVDLTGQATALETTVTVVARPPAR